MITVYYNKKKQETSWEIKYIHLKIILKQKVNNIHIQEQRNCWKEQKYTQRQKGDIIMWSHTDWN